MKALTLGTLQIFFFVINDFARSKSCELFFYPTTTTKKKYVADSAGLKRPPSGNRVTFKVTAFKSCIREWKCNNEVSGSFSQITFVSIGLGRLSVKWYICYKKNCKLGYVNGQKMSKNANIICESSLVGAKHENFQKGVQNS